MLQVDLACGLSESMWQLLITLMCTTDPSGGQRLTEPHIFCTARQEAASASCCSHLMQFATVTSCQQKRDAVLLQKLSYVQAAQCYSGIKAPTVRVK